MRRFLIFSFILFIAFGCNKPLLKYNPKFEGTWFSTPVYIDGLGDYAAYEFTFSGKKGTYNIECRDTCSTSLCDCLGTLSGNTEVNTNHTMLRINSQTPRTFTINAEPYEENGDWFLEIDGVVYTKQ